MLAKNEFDQFVTSIMVQLVGASNQGTRLSLFETMKEFFTDSNAWREAIVFQPRANIDEYLLNPKEDGQIIRLMGVWDTNNIPVEAFMPDFSRLKLLHAPSSTPPTTWTARVVKTVTLPTTSDNVPFAPDWALRVYSGAIMEGVLGNMMMQPDKSYSNDTKATYHLRRFRQAIKIARGEADTMNTTNAQAWSFPQGFTQGSQRGGVSTAFPTTRF